tara:strand:- start:504278 stop:504850 length:573 start_codon:yes stop_codon:yes gene_type:complete
MLIKWENRDTLRYFINGDLRFISKKRLAEFISNVEELTGMQLVATKTQKEGDIKVFFGPIEDYIKDFNIPIKKFLANPNFDHFFYRNNDDKGRLSNASFCIVPDKTNSYDRGTLNFKRLFLRSIGMMGYLNSRRSIFYANANPPSPSFSRKDKRLVKLLYSPEIKAGMNEFDLNKVLFEMDLKTIIATKY